MKKVKKVLVDVAADVGVAPVWFAPAMEKVMVEVKSIVSEAVAPLATKVELEEAVAPLATKVELEEAVAPLATQKSLIYSRNSTRLDLRKMQKLIFKFYGECLTREEFEKRMADFPTKNDLQHVTDSHAGRIKKRDDLDPIFDKALEKQSDILVGHGKRLEAIEAKLAMSGK